jgi:Holliday junction resolvase
MVGLTSRLMELHLGHEVAMGKYSRDKGARFERAIAKGLRVVFGERTIRSSGQCFSGDTRADVDCPKIWVECKVGKRPNIKAALEQAEEASAGAQSDKVPVAICKWDREEPIASMRFDDFVEILKLAYRGNEDGGLGATMAKTEDGDTGV